MAKLKPLADEDRDQLLKLGVDPILGKVFRNGIEIGSIGGDGYYRIWITPRNQRQKSLRRCHIIFWAANGRWPKTTIDHKDRIKTNDRISNLREADWTTQMGNRSNVIGRDLPVGVHFKPRMKSRPYLALCKGIHIGFFTTAEEASQCYQNFIKDSE